jgi:hypothetical protein
MTITTFFYPPGARMSDLNDETIEPTTAATAQAEAGSSAEEEAAPPTLPRVEPFVAIEKAGPDKAAPDPREFRLDLLPWPKAPGAAEAPPQPKPKARWRLDPLGLAAGLAAAGFVAVSLFAGYDHFHQTAMVAAKAQENQDIVKTVATLKTRIEAVEAARSQEQTAELHKTLAEVKAATQSAQGVGASVGQLAQRVDKLEKDENARLDKLGEKLEQTAANRNAEIIARLEKLEKRPATVALAQPAPPPAAPKPTATPAVSNDITGSIEKPKPLLRSYVLNEVRGNVAFLESREGPLTAAPGDVLPGAGRVLRIERHGSNWVVVTSQGVIAAPDEPY